MNEQQGHHTPALGGDARLSTRDLLCDPWGEPAETVQRKIMAAAQWLSCAGRSEPVADALEAARDLIDAAEAQHTAEARP